MDKDIEVYIPDDLTEEEKENIIHATEGILQSILDMYNIERTYYNE